MEKEAVSFEQLVKVGCGIDTHKDLIVATIRESDQIFETQEFDSYTSSLTELRDWCKSKGVSHIAIESTGIYWKPLFNILSDDFEIILVNARHVKNVPGHKTDKKDSRWLSKLLVAGLLKGSFIPPRDIRELRDLVRYRRKLIDQAASEKNRIIKTFEDANIKLSSVLTNVDGATGKKVIQDIINGVSDPVALAEHHHPLMKASKEEMIKALEGRLTPHHQFMLKMIQQSIADKEALIDALETKIDELAVAYEVELDLLQTIPGVGRDSAISIISEIGTDMERFPNEKHLSSWAGMSPGNNESGGKKKVAKTLHGNRHLQRTLAESGWGATRKKDSFFRKKYYELLKRRGKKKAVIAIGHKIIVAAYFVMKNKEAYKEPKPVSKSKNVQKQAKYFLKQLKRIGFEIDEKHLVPAQ